MCETLRKNWKPSAALRTFLRKEELALDITTWSRICVRFTGFGSLVIQSSLTLPIRCNDRAVPVIAAAGMGCWRQSWREPLLPQDATEYFSRPTTIRHRRSQT